MMSLLDAADAIRPRAEREEAAGAALALELAQQVAVVGARVGVVRQQDDDERAVVDDGLGTVPETERRIGDGDDAPVGQLEQLQRRLRGEAAQLVAAEIDDALEAARDQAPGERRRLRQQRPRRRGPGGAARRRRRA